MSPLAELSYRSAIHKKNISRLNQFRPCYKSKEKLGKIRSLLETLLTLEMTPKLGKVTIFIFPTIKHTRFVGPHLARSGYLGQMHISGPRCGTDGLGQYKTLGIGDFVRDGPYGVL